MLLPRQLPFGFHPLLFRRSKSLGELIVRGSVSMGRRPPTNLKGAPMPAGNAVFGFPRGHGDLFELFFLAPFETGSEDKLLSVLSYDLGDYRRKEIESLRKFLSSSEPSLSPWRPTKSNKQSQVRPDLFLRTTKSAVFLKESLSAFFLRSTSIEAPNKLPRLLPYHHYLLADATLNWREWPKKILQVEKALACLEHANGTGKSEFPYPVDSAVGALLFHAEDVSVIHETKERVSACLERRGSLMHDLWLSDRVLVGFSQFRNIFVTLGNIDKGVDELKSDMIVVKSSLKGMESTLSALKSAIKPQEE